MEILNLNITKTFCYFDKVTQNEISNIFESYQYEIQFIIVAALYAKNLINL